MGFLGLGEGLVFVCEVLAEGREVGGEEVRENVFGVTEAQFDFVFGFFGEGEVFRETGLVELDVCYEILVF